MTQNSGSTLGCIVSDTHTCRKLAIRQFNCRNFFLERNLGCQERKLGCMGRNLGFSKRNLGFKERNLGFTERNLVCQERNLSFGSVFIYFGSLVAYFWHFGSVYFCQHSKLPEPFSFSTRMRIRIPLDPFHFVQPDQFREN